MPNVPLCHWIALEDREPLPESGGPGDPGTDTDRDSIASSPNGEGGDLGIQRDD